MEEPMDSLERWQQQQQRALSQRRTKPSNTCGVWSPFGQQFSPLGEVNMYAPCPPGRRQPRPTQERPGGADQARGPEAENALRSEYAHYVPFDARPYASSPALGGDTFPRKSLRSAERRIRQSAAGSMAASSSEGCLPRRHRRGTAAEAAAEAAAVAEKAAEVAEAAVEQSGPPSMLTSASMRASGWLSRETASRNSGRSARAEEAEAEEAAPAVALRLPPAVRFRSEFESVQRQAKERLERSLQERQQLRDAAYANGLLSGDKLAQAVQAKHKLHAPARGTTGLLQAGMRPAPRRRDSACARETPHTVWHQVANPADRAPSCDHEAAADAAPHARFRVDTTTAHQRTEIPLDLRLA